MPSGCLRRSREEAFPERGLQLHPSVSECGALGGTEAQVTTAEKHGGSGTGWSWSWRGRLPDGFASKIKQNRP